jgi:hypothetical protein
VKEGRKVSIKERDIANVTAKKKIDLDFNAKSIIEDQCDVHYEISVRSPISKISATSVIED